MQESISIVQLAAIVAGYALAIARLTDSARPLWQWVKPPWLQTLLPALVTALPDFAAALGLVKTRVDFVQAILAAAGAIGLAMRGALPKHVFDRLPTEAKKDLKEAREPGKRSGPPPVLMILLSLLAVSCGLFGDDAKAPDTDDACPGAAKVAAVECPALAVAKCEGKPWDECAAREEIEAECDKRIDEEMAKCP